MRGDKVILARLSTTVAKVQPALTLKHSMGSRVPRGLGKPVTHVY